MLENTKFNFKQKSKDGYTALHYATLNNSLDVIKLLHKNGVDLNYPAKRRLSSLMMAC